MDTIKVWAPYAKNAAVLLQGNKLAMLKNANGWWFCTSSSVEHGNDYAFILNDNNIVPDPRSAWQPSGVFGSSRILDHNKFIWHDSGWHAPYLDTAIIYELHVGTFSEEGTFSGVIKHLDYLKNLGVTHLEIMPINTFSGTRGWGYDGVYIYAPQETYGGPEEFKKLVDACHEKKLAVILDVVYNHIGSEGNIFTNFGPYFTDRYSSPWGKAINFDDHNCYEIRRFVCDNALMWFKDYHVDALRIDAVHAIFDNSSIHILEQLAREVDELQKTLDRNLYLITESDLNEARHLRPWNMHGYGINAQWNDDFHHALHTVLTHEQTGYYCDFGSFAHLKKAMTSGFVYDGCYSSFRKRNHGTSTQGLTGNNFIGFLQNHDQIGNRAHGERLSQIVNTNLLKIGAALVFTAPFIPMIFQGEEWGALTPFLYFIDLQDQKLAKTVEEGRCKELKELGRPEKNIPTPQDIKTFINSKLNWNELQNEMHQSLLNWYQDLIKLRQQYQNLSDGRMDKLQIDFDESARWFIVKRGEIIILVNFAQNKKIFSLEQLNLIDVKLKMLLSSNENNIIKDDCVELQPESVLIGFFS